MSRGPSGPAGRGPSGGGGRRPGGPTRPSNTSNTSGKTRRGCGILAIQAALAAVTAAAGVGMAACHHTAPSSRPGRAK